MNHRVRSHQNSRVRLTVTSRCKAGFLVNLSIDRPKQAAARPEHVDAPMTRIHRSDALRPRNVVFVPEVSCLAGLLPGNRPAHFQTFSRRSGGRSPPALSSKDDRRYRTDLLTRRACTLRDGTAGCSFQYEKQTAADCTEEYRKRSG